MTRNGVLGGGALGLTAALRLAQRGEDVVLIEREPEPGGLASGFPVGDSYLEKFYHHLFRSDRAAIALINELGLGDKLLWPRPVTSTLIGGEFHQLDSPQSVLRFRPLPPVDRLRLAAAVAYLKFEPTYGRLEQQTADAWLQRWMGERVYSTLWQPLLSSKFHRYYDQITMAWFWARIHYRSASLGYIRHGFQQLYNRLVEEIERLGGRVLLDTSVTGILPGEGGTIEVQSSADTFTFDRVLSTLPTKLTVDLTPSLPPAYRDAYSVLPSLGAHCLILFLDRQLTDVYWLNINDPGFPFLALVEHTNYMPIEDYGGRHIVYLGNYLPMDHPLFRMTTQEVFAEYVPALRRIVPAFQEQWVTGMISFTAPFAQPLVTLGYRSRLPPHETPIPNLFVANMSQVYPQDRGQNYSIAMAERVVRDVMPPTSP